MTVKELVNLFHDVDFRLCDKETAEYSDFNPKELPDGEVTSIESAPWNDHIVINFEVPEEETFVCETCWEYVVEEEIVVCDACYAQICKECWKKEDVCYEHHDGRCVGAPPRYS